MSYKSPINTLKLAGIGVIASSALAAAPAALATAAHAPSSHSRPVAAAAASPRLQQSSPFTLGLSSYNVKPGATITASGLAYARAGLPLTVMSHAISSKTVVDGYPAVQTPALVEGIYKTTLHIAANAKPGTYRVLVQFNGKTVASVNDLHVTSTGGGSTTGCAGIGFTVLHNDRAGVAYLPQGAYNVTSRTDSCAFASQAFTQFLAAAGKNLKGWSSSTPGSGRATFTQTRNHHSFSVAHK